MNYKNILFQLLILILSLSCIKELNIADFTDEFGDFEQEYRIEALMLPHDDTAIIRIDKTIAIDDESLFNCEDDNDNWIASGCLCSNKNEESICPETINDCQSVGGLWTTPETNPFIDGYCDISFIEESNCSSEVFDLSWEIIDDVGIDGLPGDPTDEDGDCELDSELDDPCYTEPSQGEGNGEPDCGEPNIDDLEEITESGLIHADDSECSEVRITYNDEVCNFTYNTSAGTIYEGSGLLEFSNGSGCQEEDALNDGTELADFYYDYGAWIPDNCSENFFNHYEDGEYNLYIQCEDKIITNNQPERIPYPVVFVDWNNIENETVGDCTDLENIYECLDNNFQIDDLEFELNNDNFLTYVSTSSWYQAVQYFDPYYSCIYGGESSWTYYHGHPAVAYPPGEETYHFPEGNNPKIFTNFEEVVSSTNEDIGCYQYRMYTFSEGYSNYYFYSQLDLKDPIRSNLRTGLDGNGEVVIGAFGAMSGETITFRVTP